jgi:hypothetical protein
MVGVYDGQRYRSYKTIEAFLNAEMTSKNRGKWFYAHAGGLADFTFLLEKFAEQDERYQVKRYSLNAAFSGSSAIIVKVKDRRGKNCWHFIDSFWLLKDKLRKIGEWLGIPKGNADESELFYRDASDAELRSYNEIDCIILWTGIREFENTLLELGGQLQRTQAACAMDLFRRRFLKQDIATSPSVNYIARLAYFASRVEVISTECVDAMYYDVNSSFPHAMTFAMPGELVASCSGLPDRSGIYMADVTVHVPDNHLPPLPLRRGGRIFFPTGRWRGWFTNVDLQLLEQTGGKIVKAHESMFFEPFFELKEYATTLYAMRRDAQGFIRVALKYLLNSLYGKFAESEYKTGMMLNPDEIDPDWQMLFPGAFLFERKVPVPHMHVPISAHITSIARRTLFRFMSLSSEVHYCDTDGFSSSDEFSIVGKELGEIKLEKIIRRGTFVQPKVYRLEGETAEGKDLAKTEGEGVRAKGYSRMTLKKFEALMRGEELEYVRMRRIRELVRSGDLRPREDVIRKRLRSENISKRFFYPDGQSRPWHISELDDVVPE